jgi:two-component system, response regulator RegA
MQTQTQSPQSLLLVDDDQVFLERMGRAMQARNYTVRTADSVEKGIAEVMSNPPRFAVVDMRVNDRNGLEVVEALRSVKPDCRTIILTGYANLASAVTAIKIGAVDYLAKPADADVVHSALMSDKRDLNGLPDEMMSAQRVRWEHIQRVFELCNYNVSETARRLHMHRRTLQRILAKRAPP